MSGAAPVSIANASRKRDDIPGCLMPKESEAVFAWSSARRLQIIKAGETTDLSADDLRGLLRFVGANNIAEQL